MAYSLMNDPFTGVPSQVSGMPSYSDLESIADENFRAASEWGDSGNRDAGHQFYIPGVGHVQAMPNEIKEDNSYQNGSKYTFLVNPDVGDPGYTGTYGDGSSGYTLRAGEGGKIEFDPESRYDTGDTWVNSIPLVLAAVLSGGMASSAMGAGGILAGETAGAATGGFTIPTAAELTAAGMSPGGMAMTGAGGIGSASSVAGALGPGAYGALGYTGATALPEIGAGTVGAVEEPFFLDPNGMPMTGPGGIANPSITSLAGEGVGSVGYGLGNVGLAAEGPGSMFLDPNGMAATGPGGVGEVGSVAGELGGSASGWSGLASGSSPELAAMQTGLNAVPAGGAVTGASATTPAAATTAATGATSGLLKSLAPGLIRALTGGTSSGISGASGSGSGGFFGGNSTPGNMTPGSIAAPAAANNNQQIAQALMLGQSAQPTFNYGGYQQVPDMAQFAKALQGDQYNG